MMYLQMQILSKLCSLTKSLRTPELRQMVLCIFEKGFRVAFLSGENQINSSKTAMQKNKKMQRMQYRPHGGKTHSSPGREGI